MHLLKNYRRQRLLRCLLLASLCSVNSIASAQEMHHHPGAAATQAPPPFVASKAKSFPALMDDSMNVMNYGMANAPMNGDPDHDFASMMIPHHQGAVDMAKAELLYGNNPILRRLAQEIIVTQGSEIAVMQLELKKQVSRRSTQP